MRYSPRVRYSSVERGEVGDAAADDELLVPWWSFTKTVLAASALTLVRDGALALDRPVDGEAYTLRQLLQHTAGLGDYGEVADYHTAVAHRDEPWSVNELLLRSRAAELRYPPGMGWRYSNIGYLKVRRLIEHTAQMPLEAVLDRAVFAPLRISGAKLARARADLLPVAMGEAAGYHPGWVYHGLLVGTLGEATRLLHRLLSGALLPAELMRDMRSARPVGQAIPGRPWVAPGYGLGLMVDLAGSDGPTGHTGGGPGSTIAVFRRERRGAPITVAAFAYGGDQGAVEHVAFGAG
ncbi:MAG TPA: serine hydrolase domain-containing protein [Acetobacteraceae bacterium]|nr:serine hydrolase domain-containing protein [Acetobacteraceae bacterium]